MPPPPPPSHATLAPVLLNSKAPILFVGNKTYLRTEKALKNDSNQKILAQDRNVTPTKGDALAHRIIAVKYLECSCATGMDV